MSRDFEPRDVAGLVHWYRSDLGVVKDGQNLVSGWKDIQGSADGYATGTHQPLFVSDAVNGYPKIRFGAGVSSNDQTSTDAIWFPVSIPKPFSVFIVWQQWGSSGGSGDGGTGDSQKSIVVSDLGYYVLQTKRDAGPPTWRAPEYLTFTGDLNNGFRAGSDTFGVTVCIGDTTSSVYNNGELVVSGSTPTVTQFGNPATLSGRYNDYRDGANIDVVELCFFTGSLSQSVVSKLTDYAATKYGLHNLI